MLEQPEIVQTAKQHTAILHLTVPAAEIRNVMGPGLSEVKAAVAAQNIAITGAWFTHHLHRPTGTFDFEICVPVASPISPAGRVVPSQWSAMKVARAIYRGSYEKLGEAWGEFDAWIAAQRHTPAVDLWERYLVAPDTSSDPAAWSTELNRPLTD